MVWQCCCRVSQLIETKVSSCTYSILIQNIFGLTLGSIYTNYYYGTVNSQDQYFIDLLLDPKLVVHLRRHQLYPIIPFRPQSCSNLYFRAFWKSESVRIFPFALELYCTVGSFLRCVGVRCRKKAAERRPSSSGFVLSVKHFFKHVLRCG